MTKKDILSIACKIFGIYMLVQLVTQGLVMGIVILSWHSMVNSREIYDIIMGAVSLIFFLIYLYAAYYLIKKSDRIAERLCGKDAGGNIQSAFDRDALQQVLFSAIGVFIIANALSSIISILGNMIGQYYIKASISESMKLQTDMIRLGPISLISPMIKFILNSAIGLYLIFGSGKIVALIKKLQHK